MEYPKILLFTGLITLSSACATTASSPFLAEAAGGDASAAVEVVNGNFANAIIRLQTPGGTWRLGPVQSMERRTFVIPEWVPPHAEYTLIAELLGGDTLRSKPFQRVDRARIQWTLGSRSRTSVLTISPIG